MAKHHHPMLTKSAETGASGSPSGTTRKASLRDPDAAVDEILSLLGRELFRQARGLAAEAVERFPDHPRVRGAWGIFDNRGKAKASSIGTQPSAHEEFEWLKHPPDWARGKWVALVGPQAVAAAGSLDELMENLDVACYPKAPLAVRIDEA